MAVSNVLGFGQRPRWHDDVISFPIFVFSCLLHENSHVLFFLCILCILLPIKNSSVLKRKWFTVHSSDIRAQLDKTAPTQIPIISLDLLKLLLISFKPGVPSILLGFIICWNGFKDAESHLGYPQEYPGTKCMETVGGVGASVLPLGSLSLIVQVFTDLTHSPASLSPPGRSRCSSRGYLRSSLKYISLA